MSRDATQLEQDLTDLRRAAPAPAGVMRERVVERGSAAVRDVTVVQHVASMQLDMLSEREVRAQSTVHVTETDYLLTVDGQVAGPRPNGLIDARMGPVTRDSPCETCAGDLDHDYYLNGSALHGHICPGHFGHIELPGALFNCQLLETAVTALRCFCWFCGEMPGTTAQIVDAVRSLTARDSRGAPLSRRARLDLLSKQFGKRLRCEQCRRARRCDACRTEDAQCTTCAVGIQFRPKLVRARFGSSLPDGVVGAFPYHYQFKASDTGGTTSAAAAQAFEAFLQRERIDATARDLTPERARRAAENVSWAVAALLAPDLPSWLHAPDPALAATDGLGDTQYLARVFARATADDKERVRQQFMAWFGALVPRVVPVAPNCVRPTRFAGKQYADPTWNELTVNYGDMLLAMRQLERHGAHTVLRRAPETFTEDEREARTGGWLLRFREALVSRNPHTGEEIVQRETERWCDAGPCDMHGVPDFYALVQYHYALLIDPGEAKHYKPRNSSVRLPATARRGAARTKNKGRSFKRDAENKDGLLRNNLMGKRVDFSSRSVITGDPRLDFDELGVPQCVAAVLTKPHRICSFNIARLLRRAQRIIDGKDPVFNAAPPGGAARPQLFDADNETAIDLLSIQCIFDHPLACVGSTITLPIEDGDYVLFNRQPSLHRPSFMGHRARIMPGQTFRLNLAVTTPYNADFDGDEMNMHVPQSYGAAVEAQELMSVTRQLMLPKDGVPCIGLVQDHLLGAYLMTREHAFLERAELMQLWMEIDAPLDRVPQPAILRPRPLWTATQIVSALLPESLTLRAGALDSALLNCVRDDARAAAPPALIQRGTLHYGAVNKSLARQIIGALTTGAETPLAASSAAGSEPELCIQNACRFINGMTQVTNAFLLLRGFSIGIGDVVPDERYYSFAKEGDSKRSRYSGPAPSEFIEAFAGARERIQKAQQRLSSATPSGEAEHAEHLLDAARDQEQVQRQERLAAERKALHARVARAAERVMARSRHEKNKKIAERLEIARMTVPQRRARMAELRAELRALDAAQVERRAQGKRLASRDGVAFLRLDTERRNADIDRGRLAAKIDALFDATGQPGDSNDTAPLESELAQIKSVQQQSALRCRELCAVEVAARTRATECAQEEQAARNQAKAAAARIAATPPSRSALVASVESAEQVAVEMCAQLERDGATQFVVKRILARCGPRVRALIDDTQRKWCSQPPSAGGHAARVELLEQAIMAATTEARNDAHGVVFKAMPRHNSFRLMVDAGSKGSVTNAGEIMACPGQQAVNGRRTCDYVSTDIDTTSLPDGPAATMTRLVARTRPRFMPHDLNEYPGAEEGGMIFSSLLNGLRPREMFHYAVGARSNLIDTAIKTAPVGYLARRLIKLMEDLIVDALGGVRSARGVLVQTMLGGTGFAPQFVQRKKLPPLLMSEADLARCVYTDTSFDIAAQRSRRRARLLDAEARELRAALSYLRARTDAATYGSLNAVADVEGLLFAALAKHAGVSTSVSLAFAESAAPCWSPRTSDERSAYEEWRCEVIRTQLRAEGYQGAAVDSRVRDRAALRALLDSDDHARHCSLIDECEAVRAVRKWITSLGGIIDPATRAQLRLRLCAKQLVRRHAATPAALESFFETYGAWLRRALAVAGDAVGIVAGQSFSSVGMQMTVSACFNCRCRRRLTHRAPLHSSTRFTWPAKPT